MSVLNVEVFWKGLQGLTRTTSYMILYMGRSKIVHAGGELDLMVMVMYDGDGVVQTGIFHGSYNPAGRYY